MSQQDLKNLYDDIDILLKKYKDTMTLVHFCHGVLSMVSGVLMYAAPTRNAALKVIEIALENGERYSKELEEKDHE